MDGHDEIIVSFGKILEWAEATRQSYLINDKNPIVTNDKQKKVKHALEELRWVVEHNNIVLKINPKKSYLGKISGNASIRNDSLLDFKKIFWRKGIISHDDVLFFSFQIIAKFPFVANVMIAKYPYLFIDEFQDSNPVQIEIFKKFAQVGGKIGVVGDAAQSIYEFQGADFTQFQNFSLPGMQEYVLTENRRSSNEIINILNHIRRDINQASFRDITISKPIIFVGDMIVALREAKDRCVSENVFTLSRNNIISNAMKAEINGNGLDSKLLTMLLETDTNKRRKYIIYSCIRAIAFAKELKFNLAIKELERYSIHKSDKLKCKKEALSHVSRLMKDYEKYKSYSLIEFTGYIRENIFTELSNFRSGSIKSFYESHTFEQLYICVSIPEDDSLNKTIHKSKGDEYDNVLLILKEEKDINFLFDQNLFTDEENRINYVAVSRARNRLFISVPTLEIKTKNLLNSFFDIEYL